MKSHTYYDVLGVSRDATLEEITTAKNALAKVYHPDANVHKDIDTTEQMQNILEAYRVLSDPEKRKAYNREMFGETERVFRTFTVGPENDGEEEAVLKKVCAAARSQSFADRRCSTSPFSKWRTYRWNTGRRMR